MATLIDLSGQQWGYWTVQHRGADDANGKPMWLCVCKCGTSREVHGANLRSGKSVSCGCDRDSKTSERNKSLHAKHGGRKTTEYRIWMGIKTRCFNNKAYEYPLYGGRGVTMCKEWATDFVRFLLDVGPRPAKAYTIDRIDNDGHYEPNYVRWATKKEQANNMRSNLLITHEGRTQTLSQWAEESGVSYETLRWRHKHGRNLF